MVAAAVVLSRPLKGVRIDDSKRLSPRQRERACRAIFAHADVGIGIRSAREIDRDNILRATLAAMADAVADLPTPPSLVLVDGLQVPPLAMPARALVHGDQRDALIACASIIAKVVRDRLMAFYHQLWPAYAFDQHKGYGTPEHLARLRRWGACCMHRHSFAPVHALQGGGGARPVSEQPGAVDAVVAA